MGLPEIVVTEDDYRDLCALLEGAPAASRLAVDRLDLEIARARIVPTESVAADVVTMGATVRVEELVTDTRRVVTLVYPGDADADAGRISVLSPLGSALIGLRAGQIIEWAVPGRPRSRYRVAAVLAQPVRARRDAV